MKLSAAVLVEQGKLELLDLELVERLRPGQILVQVAASGICGAQLGEIDGHAGPDPYLPHCLGHEGAGTVVDVGPGVSQIRPNQKVVMHWRPGVGIEAAFAKYGSEIGPVGAGRVTTFQDYAVVSENRLTSIDSDVSFEHAALLGCALTTGFGVVLNEARVSMGQSIAVVGCGGVGLSVVQAARLVNCHPIYAVDFFPHRVKQAVNWGATIGLESHQMNLIAPPVDAFVDCTGNPDVIAAAYDKTAPGGKIILVGQPRNYEQIVIPNMRTHYRGKTLMDSQGGLTDPTRDIPRYLELWAAGKLSLDMQTQIFRLDELRNAIASARNKDAGRTVLVMQ